MASRRASGVTRVPLARAGPKFRTGVCTSRNRSRARGGDAGRGVTLATAGRTSAALAEAGVPPAALAAAGFACVALPSETTASTAPTGATVPSPTLMLDSTPAEIAGTSTVTLSVSISQRLSPGAILSPTALNHLTTLPSATVSPSWGIRTSMDLSGSSSATSLVVPGCPGLSFPATAEPARRYGRRWGAPCPRERPPPAAECAAW